MHTVLCCFNQKWFQLSNIYKKQMTTDVTYGFIHNINDPCNAKLFSITHHHRLSFIGSLRTGIPVQSVSRITYGPPRLAFCHVWSIFIFKAGCPSWRQPSRYETGTGTCVYYVLHYTTDVLQCSQGSVHNTMHIPHGDHSTSTDSWTVTPEA